MSKRDLGTEVGTLHIYNINLIFCKGKCWNVVPFMLGAEGSSFPFKWSYPSSALWWSTSKGWVTNLMKVMITDPNNFKASNECKLCMWLGINLKFQINKLYPWFLKSHLDGHYLKDIAFYICMYYLFICIYIG